MADENTLLPSAAKITPDRIAFRSEHVRVRGEKAIAQESVRRGTLGNQAGESRALKGPALFFRLHAGWWLSSPVRAVVLACKICKEIRERNQFEWRLPTRPSVARNSYDLCLNSLIVRRPGGDLSLFSGECRGRHRESAVVCRLGSDPSGRSIKGKCRSSVRYL